MVTNNRVDSQIKLVIAALLSDVQTLHSEVFTPRSLRLTTQKVVNRLEREGMGFLTKSTPRLAKALERALTGEVPLNSTGFSKLRPGSQLPKFLGELFQCIFSHDGWVLPTPCVECIKAVRQVLLVFYKYKLPNGIEQEENVVNKFIQVEHELSVYHHSFAQKADELDAVGDSETLYRRGIATADPKGSAPLAARETNVSFTARGLRHLRVARQLLAELFCNFDPLDIRPQHGPGAVSTKETLWDKYRWSGIPSRITDKYPVDAYFKASLGHVCDTYKDFESLDGSEISARVILVPKDSRGPRLISCEPLAFQWIQQGLGRAIVDHVEQHSLTKGVVNFTDQTPNRNAARFGSTDGRYATLDLNEASDRLSVGLVRLLYPKELSSYLLACRSLSTTLPSGEELKLNKFAPMGSALCFPILAVTCWAILTAGLMLDAGVRRGRKLPRNIPNILVYGDDVVVPTAQAANAITWLESFGLRINRDKSCVSGLFRESCGMDAYKGVDVTPVRFRTVWQSYRCPEVYTSWISYANSLYGRGYYKTYDVIVGGLLAVYGEIPDQRFGNNLPYPALIEVPEEYCPKRFRTNPNGLQIREWKVWTVKTPKVFKEIDGWSMLLRFFVSDKDRLSPWPWLDPRRSGYRINPSSFEEEHAFSVSSYTKRGASILVSRWR